jgi:cell division protein FtsQ
MSTATPLPTDVRVMNAVTALLAAALLGGVVGVLLWWVVRLPVFALRGIQVEGDVGRNSVASLRANALPRLSGSFLSLNLQQARSAFEGVPWVRRATLQRVWPMRLKVRLEEHRPVAYWETRAEGANEDSDATAERALVNSFGEVFQANLGDVEDEQLPVFAGPAGTAASVLQMWRQLAPLCERLNLGLERLDLSGRGSWRATLDDQAVIELGRGSEAEVVARFERFSQTLGQVTGHFHTSLLAADLRHVDGYAVRLRGVSTETQGKPGKQKR